MINDPSVLRVSLDQRRNHLHAAYVNAALVVMEVLGPCRAETMLADLGVSRGVIIRMLGGSCKAR